MNYDYDRICSVCEFYVEDDTPPLVWQGIVFLDVCSLLECREKFIDFLEGEAE